MTTKNKTKKKRPQGGQNIPRVSLAFNGNPINCEICGNNDYYERDSTVGRSKTSEFWTNMFASDELSAINDISIFCFFCNTCGNAKIIRNSTFSKQPEIIQVTQL